MNSKPLPDFLSQALLSAPDQRVTFAEFMERVLYDPTFGYYNRDSAPMGKTGDYLTSPHLSPDFGELVAVQLVQMWQALAQPALFTVVEMGAGQGVLAADILRFCQAEYPDFYQALSYVIIERSERLRETQKNQLRNWAEIDRAIWRDWGDIPLESVVGCFLSNELVDALPVHRVCWQQGELQEIYVRLNESHNQLTEELGPLSTPGLATYFEFLGLNLTTPPYPDGYRTEVNLAALDWLTAVAHRLAQGFVLTIDYGYPATTYYHPNRSDGTLQAYYQHRHHNNPYIHLGQQDLTAHVDFTTLERWGEQQGLRSLILTHQAPWLMSLGLAERLRQNNQTSGDINHALRRRAALQQLIDPLGLGGLRVLLQGKGGKTLQPLRMLALDI
ncbi:class I SAM-dependent methyltransferase [Synechococcus sp. PCC 6312]|uniref:class I SAM-dependent methyltransferase n=1 Tax=Synechococcus sp. (strain ATCC 27167 / PCC 6312) TaxID=195253 RepID=UPI00029F2D3F|nr:class I SAM-dependent methyltransferase [Synechococcus sp. PCC 6312]AFY59592.1 hypothetical protein Syn6312_0360 [Synechococcus sp. PCC 6312]